MGKPLAKKGTAGELSAVPELSSREFAAQRASELEARCPFCRDAIQVEANGWTACTLCLGRHHTECWREHGCCASCGGDRNLTFVTVRDDLRRRAPTQPARREKGPKRALALAAACLLAGALGLLLSA